MQAAINDLNPGSSVQSTLISAVTCGVLCGPAAVGLALIAEYLDPNGLNAQLRQCFGLLAMIVLGSAFAFSALVRSRLAPMSSRGKRVWANIAIGSSVFWITVLAGYMLFVLSVV